MSAFTGKFFTARKTYGAILSGIQYELISTEDGDYIEVDDGRCYEVEFDRYDSDVIFLKVANSVKLDAVGE